MRKFAVLFALLAASTAHAQIQRPTDVYYEDGGSSGAGSIHRHRHSGGPNTLPYGHAAGWVPELATHAQSMPAVQCAMQRMQERGYVRRPDLDAGMALGNYATVVLGYEKPGVPGYEAYPVITVTTQPFYVSGSLRWVPTTQVACGIFRDSSGVLVPTHTPFDSATVITATGGASAIPTGALESAIAGMEAGAGSDIAWRWAYTTHDAWAHPPTFSVSISPANQYLWGQYGSQMALATTGAAFAYGRNWLPPPAGLGWQNGLYSVSVAAWAAHTHFWMHPPDTTGMGQ